MTETTDITPAPETAIASPPRGLMVRFGIGCIRLYQKYISPLTPPTCRYSPTCSAYALTAIQKYGFFKGSWMGMLRISRCHPLHEGGYDPVP